MLTLRWLKYASKHSLLFIFHIYINCVWLDFSLKLLKMWIKHRKIIIKSTQRIRFLKFTL